MVEGVSVIPLLTVVSMPKPEHPPLMLELQVPSNECAPFLVSSSRDLLWVGASESGVRVGVRQCSPSDLFFSVVVAVADKGDSEGWGNVVSTLREAADHLDYYGLEYDVLVGAGTDSCDLDTLAAHWLPAGWGVVVPKDRDYLGTVYDFGEGFVAALVHNPARGLAIVRPGADLD
jgi:hypothetical protein